MPRISVILPVRNAQRTIARAVDSVLGQTFADFELVVVNDGSTDATLEILSRYADARIRVTTTNHQGVRAAANLGTQLSRASTIARMDADDFARPDRLELQYQYLETRQFDVVGSQVAILDESGCAVSSLARYERWINEETIDPVSIRALRFVEFPLVNPTILARRRYFELMYEESCYPEDYDLMLRAAEIGMQFGKVPSVLLDWTDHEQRLTRTDESYSDNAFMKCRRRYFLRGPLCGAKAVDVWGVGHTGKPWMRWLQQQGVRIRYAYDLSPRKSGQRIHGVTVLHPELLSRADGTLLVIAVGAEGARSTIRPQLEAKGYALGVDAWFVA